MKILLTLAVAFLGISKMAVANDDPVQQKHHISQDHIMDQNQHIEKSKCTDQEQCSHVGATNEIGNVLWVDYGQYMISKYLNETITINLFDEYVNEISLRAVNADVEVKSAVAYLTNGETLELIPDSGTYLEKGHQFSTSLVYNNPIRLEKIVLTVASPEFDFTTPKTRVSVAVGLVR